MKCTTHALIISMIRNSVNPHKTTGANDGCNRRRPSSSIMHGEYSSQLYTLCVRNRETLSPCILFPLLLQTFYCPNSHDILHFRLTLGELVWPCLTFQWLLTNWNDFVITKERCYDLVQVMIFSFDLAKIKAKVGDPVWSQRKKCDLVYQRCNKEMREQLEKDILMLWTRFTRQNSPSFMQRNLPPFFALFGFFYVPASKEGQKSTIAKPNHK